ncbi:predicted protein [Thalassiosira pseudonana CCMP1335]|uniref:ApaG domain-containing protein n=1 Tax=Thalassiosira pseudonana TaxID=35128 RepID=B8C306_THAPS|nr:predicted protein [Thalassiosira pseudonana CCMP1335]EED92042.1 predicted protein [Thalassiosira pseudonana CCMP1335]
MKTASVALSIVLSTSSTPSWTSAFTPTSLRHRSISVRSSQPASSSCRSATMYNKNLTTLHMVGGGMIERPPGDSSSDDDSPKDDSDSSEGISTRTRSTLGIQEGDDDFLASIGKSSIKDIDPWDPNVYIKPRPGKYGWEPIQQIDTEQIRLADSKLVQRMSDGERDDNLKMIKQLWEEGNMLAKFGDEDGAAEARKTSMEKRAADPWYGLNERLEEAVQLEEVEEVEYLQGLIAKVGGAPPALKKAESHPRGYVLESDIVGIPLSNARLQRMIDQTEAELGREERRKERINRDLKELENPQKDTFAEEEAEIREIARERAEKSLQILATKGLPDEERVQKKKEDFDKARKELMEKWKNLGQNKEPEEVYSDFIAREDFLENTMSGFAEDMRRITNLYEDDDDDEYDEDGGLATAEDKYAEGRPMSKAAQARAEAMKNDGSGRPRLPGDTDVTRGELDEDMEINEASSSTTGPLTVEVSSAYNSENSDPPMRKHCFQYTVRITNNSPTDTVQLLSRRFEIQTVGSSMKDVVQGEGVTGRQPILKPGEVFEYTSTAPLSVRPIGTTEIAARMSGEYRYCTLQEGQEKATDEQVNKGQGEAGAELATFHFVFPEKQRVKPVKPDADDDDDDEDEDSGVKTTTVASSAPAASPAKSTSTAAASPPASTLPGEPDMTSGNIATTPNDSSDTVTSDVRVVVTSTYRPERSDAKLDKHCFAYNVRITNESKNDQSIQLVSRRFEIQTVGSANKDVVQGPGVTGRQPVLKPGESFEYTSTAPLSVRPMMDKTQVVARMSGEYNFVQLSDDGVTPMTSTPLKAELGAFHFILPEE